MRALANSEDPGCTMFDMTKMNSKERNTIILFENFNLWPLDISNGPSQVYIEFIMLIIVKMPTISWHFNIIQHDKVHALLCWYNIKAWSLSPKVF